MKRMLTIIGTLLLLVIATQIWAKVATNNIETHPYKVIKKFEGFEIREYEPATFSYVTMKEDTYENASGKGFNQLAGYIFGGNEKQQKIAMTSPVEMEMEDSITMKFMVPSKYEMEDLPRPNNSNVRFVEEPSKIVAAVQFSGYANDNKIKLFKNALIKMLNHEEIEYTGSFSFLGYNSPWDFFNRRNEIIVEVNYQ